MIAQACIVVCDICGVESAPIKGDAATARARLANGLTAEPDRWTRTGHQGKWWDVCPVHILLRSEGGLPLAIDWPVTPRRP